MCLEDLQLLYKKTLTKVSKWNPVKNLFSHVVILNDYKGEIIISAITKLLIPKKLM